MKIRVPDYYDEFKCIADKMHGYVLRRLAGRCG